ncbi:hypothetical protein GCM10009834_50290 [Streptomonospora arabica]|uniref:Uncharacterized protein n=1 Tax=Streptomonospora halophila TaxID=427369 RepID=A0ABP9G8A9_9ACTN
MPAHAAFRASSQYTALIEGLFGGPRTDRADWRAATGCVSLAAVARIRSFRILRVRERAGHLSRHVGEALRRTAPSLGNLLTSPALDGPVERSGRCLAGRRTTHQVRSAA